MNFAATSALSIDDDDKLAVAIPVASTVIPTPTLGLLMDDDNGHPHLQLFPMITTLGHTVSDANASTRASEYAFIFLSFFFLSTSNKPQGHGCPHYLPQAFRPYPTPQVFIQRGFFRFTCPGINPRVLQCVYVVLFIVDVSPSSRTHFSFVL